MPPRSGLPVQVLASMLKAPLAIRLVILKVPGVSSPTRRLALALIAEPSALLTVAR